MADVLNNDQRSGRDSAPVVTLSDTELDAELTIVAAALVPRRLERYAVLLEERDRRRGLLVGNPAA